jgi:hypothetical protein
MYRVRLPHVATLVSAAFLISIIPAHSATIAGTKCTKLNSTKTISNIKYTCIKSGKKLVWNKGIALKQVAIPTPKPTPSQSPTSQINPNSSEIKAGDSCNSSLSGTVKATSSGLLVCRHDSKTESFLWSILDSASAGNTGSATPTPKPTGPASPITLDNLDPEWTSVVAYSRMVEYAKTLPKPNIANTLVLSPTVESRPYKRYISGLEEVAQSLYPIYKNPKYTIVLFTEKDSEWIDQTQTRLMGNYLINPTQQLQSYRIKNNGCNIGGFYLPNIIMFCVKEQSELSGSIDGNYSAAHSFPHEYFHLAQFIGTDYTNIPVLGTLATANMRFRSCWMDEGFATFYGFAFGSYPLGDPPEARFSFLKTLSSFYGVRRGLTSDTVKNLLLKNDPKVVLELYKEVEPNLENCPDTQNAYFLGEIAGEALVASFGAKSLNDFQIEFGKTADWKASFENIFGIKVDDFYAKLTPYLASQAKKFPN